MFSKDLFCRHVKTRACLGKGKTNTFDWVTYHKSYLNAVIVCKSYLLVISICPFSLKVSYPIKNRVHHLSSFQTSPAFNVFAVQVFCKHYGKRRNCSSQAISPFPRVFSIRSVEFLLFSSNLKLSSANAFSFVSLKFYVLERPVKVPIAPNYKGVCLQNTSKFHPYILKYGDYCDFMNR